MPLNWRPSWSATSSWVLPETTCLGVTIQPFESKITPEPIPVVGTWPNGSLGLPDAPDSVIVTIAALGCLYWLLWTLLVYEGGIFLKFWAVGRLLFTRATLADLGYEGSYAQGDLEGWFGNCAALVLTVVVFFRLRRLYREAAAKHAKAG